MHIMEPAVHIHIGKDRRIAIPSRFCKQANIQPGDGFLLSCHGKQIVLTPLDDEAEHMRQDLRALLGNGVTLMEDLRQMRAADIADETHRR
jgi:hypothetical protein